MSALKHSPLPWSGQVEPADRQTYVLDADGHSVCEINPERRRDEDVPLDSDQAMFIITATAFHAELVDALQATVRRLEAWRGSLANHEARVERQAAWDRANGAALFNARAVLAKVRP